MDKKTKVARKKFVLQYYIDNCDDEEIETLYGWFVKDYLYKSCEES